MNEAVDLIHILGREEENGGTMLLLLLRKFARDWANRPLQYQNLVLLIECSKLAFKSCVYLQCIQPYLVDMTLNAQKMNA